jgi:hypothetical protein
MLFIFAIQWYETSFLNKPGNIGVSTSVSEESVFSTRI